MKKFLPLALRIRARQFLDKHWGRRYYDSPLFGWLWSVGHRNYRTDGLVFEMPLDKMPMGFRSRFFFDSYEKEERCLAVKHISKDSSILELGACIGVVSCVCNRILDDKSKHVVVEANPSLIPWLEKNREKNESRFKIEHCLLSDSSDGSFRIEKFIVSGSAQTTTGKVVKVPVMTLQEVCEKTKIYPNTIVMDIEGGELDFLDENRQWIIDHKEINLMIIEFHPFIIGDEQVSKVKAILGDLGFKSADVMGVVEVWKRQ